MFQRPLEKQPRLKWSLAASVGILALASSLPFAVSVAWAEGAGAPHEFSGSTELAPDDAQASNSIRMETFRTHSRLSFHIEDGVGTEFKADNEGFELVLKGLGLGDLGAPLGEEGRWANRYKNLRDPRLKSLEFSEVAGGVKVRGTWKYGQGPNAPANPQMEAFDYRERAHAQLVVDFWTKEGPTVGQVTAQKAVTRRIASVKKHEDDEKARLARRIAREKARAIAEDPKLFCGSPLSERSDVFLQFLPVHEPVAFNRWFSAVSPDADYSYYSPTGKSNDARYVRLAIKLYGEGNFALVNRTLDFFDQECPDSPYRGEMRFLRANALLKLGLTEEGMRLLQAIQKEPKSSRVSLQAGMFLARQQFDAKNYLGALESFSWLADHQAENRQAWVFHLGAAECARALRQTDRASQEYQWVAEHAPDSASQAEGALRMGDLYLDRFQYDQGLAAYATAIRHFGKEADQFAPVFINRADALYGLGQFERAREAYEDFLKRFPSHPAGWRATYRLGELVARNEGQSAKGKAFNRESPEANRWYLDTINRYPFSPGATLARLQLIPCGDHGGFSADAADRFFGNEAEKLDGSGEVAMERYKDFRALSRVRSLMTMGKQEDAVANAVAELQRVVRPEARRWLSKLLVFNFRRSVVELLDKGQKLAALTFYQNNADTVPVSDGSLDPEYLLKLSQAASDLNLGKLAQEITGVFEKARKSREQAGREPAAELAESESDLKLQAAERAFTEAKALWVGDGMKVSGEVRARLGQVIAESKFSQEREIILGLIEARSGDPKAALRHAAQAQLLGPRMPRIDAWVASLEAQVGDAHAALVAFRALEEAKETGYTVAELLGVPAMPSREALILAQSEIFEKEGRWGESAANYARAVDKGWVGAEARYNYARALLKAGGIENHGKAIVTLEKLAAEEKPVATASPGIEEPAAKSESAKSILSKEKQEREKFWRKLASETLADEKAKSVAKEGTKQ